MVYNKFYFIYVIKNVDKGWEYIGYTNDLNRRLFDHLTQLDLNQHPNEAMQSDYNKYTFVVEVLDTHVNKSNYFI